MGMLLFMAHVEDDVGGGELAFLDDLVVAADEGGRGGGEIVELHK